MTAAKDLRNVNVKGWGVDTNEEDQPAYPMKKNRETDVRGMDWERPAQQRSDIEVLKSIERPSLSAAYGTVVPPSGLSGMLRRFAFRHSESTYLHWLPLMLADRINVVEGLLQDLKHGHVPNIFAEMGIRSEARYNRKGLMLKSLVAGSLVAAFLVYRRRRK